METNKINSEDTYHYCLVLRQFNRYGSPSYTSIDDYPQDLHQAYILHNEANTKFYSYDKDKDEFYLWDDIAVEDTVGGDKYVTEFFTSKGHIRGVTDRKYNMHRILGGPPYVHDSEIYVIYSSTTI